MRLSWDSIAVVDLLLRNTTKNQYLANGHNYQGFIPCYLPGNGGLLSAVAMMAGGYIDSSGKAAAVGFPPEWHARSEGFMPYP
jgi:hypothetical protein